MSTEITTNPDLERAKAATEAAITPEAFDFALAVQGRSYPEFDVAIYLDESKIQRMLTLQKERDGLEIRIVNSSAPSVEQAEKLADIDKEFEGAVQAIRDQRYTVHIKGISPEESQKIEDASYAAFPREYTESNHPLTGAVIKHEASNDDRDSYFASLLRQAHIQYVVAPNGAIDRDFDDLEKVKSTWARLPFLARAKVDQAINEATIAVDYYNELVDEVF